MRILGITLRYSCNPRGFTPCPTPTLDGGERAHLPRFSASSASAFQVRLRSSGSTPCPTATPTIARQVATIGGSLRSAASASCRRPRLLRLAAARGLDVASWRLESHQIREALYSPAPHPDAEKHCCCYDGTYCKSRDF